FQTMWSVQLPQALSNMIPSLLNQFVSTIKATSIVYIIGVQEAAFSAQQINSIELTGALRTYLVLALFYFLLCALLSRLAKRLEQHLRNRRRGVAIWPGAHGETNDPVRKREQVVPQVPRPEQHLRRGAH